MKLRIHGFLPFSYANGPGCRAVLWLQGCPLRCPGCCNPKTHEFNQGHWATVQSIVKQVLALSHHIEGITVSGGEPLAQVAALTELLCRVKERTVLGTILFTGYTWQEAQTLLGPGHRSSQGQEAGQLCPDHARFLLDYVDLLLAGRYDHHQRLAWSLRGSANKTLHFLTQRYTAASLSRVPPAEIILSRDGRVLQSGIMPLRLEPTDQTIQ